MKRMMIAAVMAAVMMTAAGCPAQPPEETVATTPAQTETQATTEEVTEESEEPSEEATEEETEAPVEETTIAPRPAEIAFSDEAYTEFAEPVAYNVVNDTVAYRDSALVTVNREIPAGGMVIGLGSDGNYIITDSQEFVPLADLEEM